MGGNRTEVAFLVVLKRSADAQRLTAALGRVEGVESVSLYYDEDRPL